MTTRLAARWSFFLIALIAAARPVAPALARTDEAALLAERDAAVEQVKRIVNQPVEALPLSPDVKVAMFRPAWFHDGASRPDFLHVDVSQSQQFAYDKFEFVASDISPGVMFRGRDLEFNPNTKLFYTDRTVPKKKLTPAEMAEINRLYRIIGAREQEVAQGRAGAMAAAPRSLDASPGGRNAVVPYAAAAVLLPVLVIAFLRLRARRA